MFFVSRNFNEKSNKDKEKHLENQRKRKTFLCVEFLYFIE